MSRPATAVRERELNEIAYRLREAMAVRWELAVVLDSGRTLRGCPERVVRDDGLTGELSNLVVTVGGESVPVARVQRIQRDPQ